MDRISGSGLVARDVHDLMQSTAYLNEFFGVLHDYIDAHVDTRVSSRGTIRVG